MWERVKHMLIKEFIQIFRDPKMIGVIFIAPFLQIIMFGFAVTTDVRNVPTAVYDLDQTVASRELAARFERSGYFTIVNRVYDEEQARKLIDQGKVSAILRTNKGFSQDLAGGRTAHVQVIVDGTDSNTAQIVVGYSSRIIQQYSQELLNSRIARDRGVAQLPGQVNLETRAWFNDNLESRNYFVPGVIASIVMLVTLLLTSMAVVREKEIGTMEQVMVTPIRPVEFILGKTLPFALIGLIDVVMITVVGVFIFEVPLRGSLWLLFLGAALYLMSTLGIGLLISTVSQTQQQAMITTFFLFFPMILLSGFMFPIANMPTPVQWLTYANPLRYFLVIIRGIFLKGVAMDVLWPQFLGLAIIGPLLLGLASRRFHKTLA